LLVLGVAIAQIPDSYDWTAVVPECNIPVLNQGNCGSCWAFSVVEALSMRFCSSSKGKVKPLLSPQYLANCDTGSAGCGGGDTMGAYTYIGAKGNDLTSCTAYTSGKTGRTGACPATCDDTKAILPSDLYFDSRAYSLNSGVAAKNVAAMQSDILENGPISASFIVYRDFLDFFNDNKTKNGVYTHKTGSALGGHAIVIFGWGVQNNVPYWLARNSWGEAWGVNGNFKIIRGQNDCTIESRRLTAGIPQLNSTRKDLPTEIEYVCDGCWTKQEDIEEFIPLALSQNGVPAHAQVKQVRTQVVNGVHYKIDLSIDGSMHTLVLREQDAQTNIVSFYQH